MSGMFLLRWIDLPPTTGQTVDTPTLLASTEHGLKHFYRYTKHLLDASMLVGVPDNPTPQVKGVAAAPENDETLSIYPLLVASGMLLLPDKTDTQAKNQHRTYGLSHDEHDPIWPLRRKWNTPVGSRDPSLGARLAEATVLQEIYRSFREKVSDFTSFDYEKGRQTWGSVMANVAKRNNEKPQAFAARVLACLEARSNQLRFVTWWFTTVFGDVDLSLFGDTRTRQLYAIKRQRKWTAPETFRRLVDAFAHEPRGGTERSKTRTRTDPDVEMAEKIEATLLAVLRG